MYRLCFIRRIMSKPSIYPVKKLIGLSEEQAQRIADFRFEKRIGSESEAIRQLIELGLDASEKSDT